MQNYKGTSGSVSESEKLVMAAAGCRFTEKVEPVPIKKRWSLFMSPSPPLIAQCAEELEGLQNSQHNSCQNSNMNSTIECEKEEASDTITSANIDATGVDDKKTDVQDNDHLLGVDEKKTDVQGNDHPVSGISVLATVACNNRSEEYGGSGGPVVAGMPKVHVKTEPEETETTTNLLSDQRPCSSVVLHAPVKTEYQNDSSYLPIPVISSQDLRVETIRTLLKNHVLENVNHDASSKITSGSHNNSNIDDSDETARDGRLHWDLNTAMDAWDHPSDGNKLEERLFKNPDDRSNVNRNALDNNHQSTDVPTVIVSVTPKNEPKHNTTLDVCDFPREIGDANNSTERALAPLEFKSLSVEPLGTEVKDTKSIDISKENSSAEIKTGFDEKKTNSVFDKDRSDALPISLFVAPLSLGANTESHPSDACERDHPMASVSISLGANIESHPSDACERVQPTASVSKSIYCADANISGREHNNSALSDLSVHDSFGNRPDEQICNKERLEEVGHHTDVYASDIRMDYDSQYEDGELRESSLHIWEEDDGEDLDIDRVDYGSDNRDINNMDSENTECNSQAQPGGGSFRSGVVDAGYPQDDTAAAASSTACLSVHCPVDQVDTSKGSGSIADQAIGGDDEKGDISQMNVAEIETNTTIDMKTRTSGWDLMPPNSCRSSSDVVSGDTRYNRNIEKDPFSYKRVRAEPENKERKTFDTGVNNRSEVFSRIERPTSSGRVFIGKDRLGPRGDSSNEDDPFFRSEREFVRPFGRGRYPLQRGGANMWGDSSPGCERGGMKRLRSPSYHGGMGSNPRHCGPGDVVSDGRRVNSRRYNNGRNGTPPEDRHENYNMHRVGGGIRPGGGVEMSPDRCITVGRGGGRGVVRSSATRYGGPQLEGGGGPRGGRYHHHHNNAAPIENDNVESNYMHPLSVRGRRSFSPPPDRRGGNSHQFGPKSHQVSRARSPDGAWQSRNGGNIGFRNRNSRSPNFRPRGGRSPCSRPDFAGDQESGFAPVSSMDHRDPPQTTRWFNYKHRSPPPPGRGGNGRPWVEDEMIESNRKLNNNEYGRPVYPARHPEFNGMGRGRPRFDVGDDNRKEYRFRRGVGMKRYRYNEGAEEDEEGMVDFHRRPQGATGEAGRRSAEERGHFLPRQERKYNNNKPVGMQVGMQDSDEDMAAVPPPRRRMW